MINFAELTQNVIDGDESPFKALGILKELQRQVKDCIDLVDPIALEEAKKYEKEFNIDGYKIEQRNGSRRFSFKNIEEWNSTSKSLKEIEGKYKAAFSSFEKGLQAVSEDGEVLQMPEVTYSKDSLIFKKL